MEEPTISQLERAESPTDESAVVLCAGDLSTEDPSPDSWIPGLRAAGWRGEIWHIWWDTSPVTTLLGEALAAKGADLSRGPTRQLAAAAGSGAVRKHWMRLKRRAKRVGRDHVAALLQALPTDEIVFVGHSLGVRVIYYALVDAVQRREPVEHALLLGGALRRDKSKDWELAASGVRGKLVNVFSTKDRVLRYAFRGAELGENPCGRKPIKKEHEKIVNVDAKKFIKNAQLNPEDHWVYQHILPPVAEAHLSWRPKTLT